MTQLIIFTILLLLGIFVGGANERKHLNYLESEEKKLAHIKITNLKKVMDRVEPGGALVNGNVVVALDYFKKIKAAIRTLFGGEIKSFQTLLTRARREAILRMKQEANALGADRIYNVRLEFSAIGQLPRIGGVEILAYGTALKTNDKSL